MSSEKFTSLITTQAATDLTNTVLSDDEPHPFSFGNVTTHTGNNQTESIFMLNMAISFTLLAFTSLIVVFTILGNMAVLLAFYLETPLRANFSNYLVVSMAASDLLLGVLALLPSMLNVTLGFWIFGYLFCQIWDLSVLSLTIITQTNAFFIAVDRYLGVRHPTAYRTWKTQIKMILLVVSIWTITAGFVVYIYICCTVDGSPDFSIARPQCVLRMPDVLRMIIFCLTFFVRLTIMICIYWYLYKVSSNISHRLVAKRLGGQLFLEATATADPTTQDLSSFKREDNSNQNMWTGQPQDGWSRRYDYTEFENRHSVDNRKTSNVEINNGKLKQKVEADIDLKSDSDCKGRKILAYVTISLTNSNTNSSKSSSVFTVSTKKTKSSIKSSTIYSLGGTTQSKREAKRALYTDNQPHRECTTDPKVQTSSVDPHNIDSGNDPAISPATSPATNLATELPYGPDPVEPENQKTDNQEIYQRHLRKAVRTVSFIVIANTLFFGPYAVVTIVVETFGIYLSPHLFFASVYFMFINSCVNPLMYALVNPLFKATFIRIFMCHWHKNESVTALMRQ